LGVFCDDVGRGRGELFFELHQLVAQLGDFVFQLQDALCQGGIGSFSRGPLRRYRGGGKFAGEQMGIADLFCAGLTREGGDEGWIAVDELLQDGDDVFQFFEAVDTLRAAAELAGSLGATQEQDAEESGFASGEVEDFLEAVLIFGDAAVVAPAGAGEALIFETMEREARLFFVDLHDRLAVVLLIAGVDERVEGERVILRGGGFFFDQRTKDTGFDGSEAKGHRRVGNR
jgi:hypothetical protein